MLAGLCECREAVPAALEPNASDSGGPSVECLCALLRRPRLRSSAARPGRLFRPHGCGQDLATKLNPMLRLSRHYLPRVGPLLSGRLRGNGAAATPPPSGLAAKQGATRLGSRSASVRRTRTYAATSNFTLDSPAVLGMAQLDTFSRARADQCPEHRNRQRRTE